MIKILLIGAGGFIGSICRYYLGGLANKIAPAHHGFPYGTVTVNIAGCFLIGLIAALVETRQILSHELRMFIMIGILGGFTTFSAFSSETLSMFHDGQALKAGANVAMNIIFGLGAVWVGSVTSRAF